VESKCSPLTGNLPHCAPESDPPSERPSLMQPAGNEEVSYYPLRVTAHCNRRRPSPNANQWWTRVGKIVSVSNPNSTNEAPQRERELQRACNFYTALLAMAGHDRRQPLQGDSESLCVARTSHHRVRAGIPRTRQACDYATGRAAGPSRCCATHARSHFLKDWRNLTPIRAVIIRAV
jgi:hypothetical protein